MEGRAVANEEASVPFLVRVAKPVGDQPSEFNSRGDRLVWPDLLVLAPVFHRSHATTGISESAPQPKANFSRLKHVAQ